MNCFILVPLSGRSQTFSVCLAVLFFLCCGRHDESITVYSEPRCNFKIIFSTQDSRLSLPFDQSWPYLLHNASPSSDILQDTLGLHSFVHKYILNSDVISTAKDTALTRHISLTYINDCLIYNCE